MKMRENRTVPFLLFIRPNYITKIPEDILTDIVITVVLA